MPTYFILSCPSKALGPDPALLTDLSDEPDRGWETGQRFSTDPNDFPEEQAPSIPVRFRITPDNAGALREMWEAPAPVMTRRLADSLRAGGVVNLDTYDAVIEDLPKGVTHKDYVAFNLIGLAVARASASSEGVDELHWLDPQVFGEAPAELLMFRPKAMPYYIRVHERLRAHLQGAGFDMLRFTDPKVYAN